MTAGVSQQRKSLIVEIERRIEHAAVLIHGRDHGALVPHKPLVQKIERMPAGLAPWSVPSKSTGFAVAKGLPGGDARPLRQDHRSAVEVDRLVVAAEHVTGADAPPKRQRSLEQPLPQLLGRSVEVAPTRFLRNMHRSTTSLRSPFPTKTV